MVKQTLWENHSDGEMNLLEPMVAHNALFFNNKKDGREIVWVWIGTSLNFFVFLAAKYYYTKVNG